MYDIIAIGDGQFLYQILNFLALLNNSGIFTKLGLLGGMMGIVFLLLGSIMKNAQDFPVGQMIVGVVLFMVFFGQTASVRVEDYYSGQTRVVDNVPLGTAIVGSMISGVGVALADNFMQASAVPGVEELPYNYVLDALMATRDLTDGTTWTSPEMQEADRAIQEYIRSCVMPIYRTTGAWPQGEDPTTAEDAWAALRTDSQVRSMQDFIGATSGLPKYQTCVQGWNEIDAFMHSPAFTAEVDLAITRHLHRQTGAAEGGAAQYDRIFEMLQQESGNGQLALKNAVIANIAARSQSGDEIDSNKVASTILTTTAANQRNVQFAAETSLWLRMVRGMMTFFEGVSYGMAPFAALLIPFGAYGMRVGLRYVAILLWIFLWIPLLSFVNLFTIDAVTGQLDALQQAGSAPIHSVVGIMNAQYTAADYIGIAGWLAPTVAALAGVLVFGGLAGFNSLAGRVNGADFIKEDQIAPNALQTGALHSQSALMTHSPGEGTMLTGSATQSWGWGDVSSRNSSYKLSDSVSAYEKFGQTLKNATGSNASISDTFNTSATVTDTHRSGTSDSVTSTGQNTATYTDKDGASTSYSANSANSAETQMTAKGNVGAGTPGGSPVSVSFGGGMSGTAKQISAERSEAEVGSGVTLDQARSTGLASATSANNAAELAKGLATGTIHASQLGVTGSKAEELTKAAEQAWSATQAYEQSVSEAASHSSNLQITEQQASAHLAGSGNLDSVVGTATSLAGAYYHDRLAAMEHSGASGLPKYATAEQRQAAAALLALGDAAGDASLPAGVRQAAGERQAEALASVVGGHTGGIGRSEVSAAVGGYGGDVRDAVGSHTQGIADQVSAAGNLHGSGESVDSVYGRAGSQIQAGAGAVASANPGSGHAAAAAAVQSAYAQGSAALGNAAYHNLMEHRLETMGYGNDFRGAFNAGTTQLGALAGAVSAGDAAVSPALGAANEALAALGYGDKTISPGAMGIGAAIATFGIEQAGGGAFGEYDVLANYATVSGIPQSVRSELGITPEKYEAMGLGVAHVFGADTQAAVKVMGEVGFKDRPEFTSMARDIAEHHRAAGTPTH